MEEDAVAFATEHKDYYPRFLKILNGIWISDEEA